MREAETFVVVLLGGEVDGGVVVVLVLGEELGVDDSGEGFLVAVWTGFVMLFFHEELLDVGGVLDQDSGFGFVVWDEDWFFQFLSPYSLEFQKVGI